MKKRKAFTIFNVIFLLILLNSGCTKNFEKYIISYSSTTWLQYSTIIELNLSSAVNNLTRDDYNTTYYNHSDLNPKSEYYICYIIDARKNTDNHYKEDMMSYLEVRANSTSKYALFSMDLQPFYDQKNPYRSIHNENAGKQFLLENGKIFAEACNFSVDWGSIHIVVSYGGGF